MPFGIHWSIDLPQCKENYTCACCEVSVATLDFRIVADEPVPLCRSCISVVRKQLKLAYKEHEGAWLSHSKKA